MSENIDIKYSYRKWPIFIPAYFIFSLIYFFSFYSLRELNYRNIAEDLVMTIFILSPVLLIFFDLKIEKIAEYKKLALDIFYSWIISSAVIFLLMLTYLEGEEWFGAIALFFFLFIYNIFALLLSFFLFKFTKKKQITT